MFNKNGKLPFSRVLARLRVNSMHILCGVLTDLNSLGTQVWKRKYSTQSNSGAGASINSSDSY
eukprot:960150-Pelagomonas_calceolata.AAC.1